MIGAGRVAKYRCKRSNFGKALLNLRIKYGIRSSLDAHKITGVSADTWRAWERGFRTPKNSDLLLRGIEEKVASHFDAIKAQLNSIQK